MKRIFLNYRREDTAEVAKRIHEAFSRSFRKKVTFIDIEAIPPGLDYRKVILRSIDQSGVFLALIGPGWLGSVGKDGRRRLDALDDPVRSEIESAMLRDVTILPVLVGGAAMPAPDDLPASSRNLAYQNALSVRDGQNFDKDVDRVKDVVRGLLATSRGMIAPAIASACLIAFAGGIVGFLLRPAMLPDPARPLAELKGPDPKKNVPPNPVDPGRPYGDFNDSNLKKYEPPKVVDPERDPTRKLLFDYYVPELLIAGFHGHDEPPNKAAKYAKVPVTLGRKRLGNSKDRFDDLRISVRGLNSPSVRGFPGPGRGLSRELATPPEMPQKWRWQFLVRDDGDGQPPVSIERR